MCRDVEMSVLRRRLRSALHHFLHPLDIFGRKRNKRFDCVKIAIGQQQLQLFISPANRLTVFVGSGRVFHPPL